MSKQKIDRRELVCKKYKQNIQNLHEAMEIIKSIPLHQAIYILTTVMIRYGPNSSPTWGDSYFLAYPIKINWDSVRCRILAIEQPCWDAHLLSEDPSKPYMKAIRFLAIKSWRPYMEEDGPLLINWAGVSNEFKMLLSTVIV
jgi:hypothetical protein